MQYFWSASSLDYLAIYLFCGGPALYLLCIDFHHFLSCLLPHNFGRFMSDLYQDFFCILSQICCQIFLISVSFLTVFFSHSFVFFDGCSSFFAMFVSFFFFLSMS